MSSSIFIVDSSPAVRRMVEETSTPEGFEVVGFQDGPAALEAARRISPALIIADYHLDNMTFSGFCKEVNKLDHLTETYLISLIDPADRPDEGHLRTLGVKAFLKKPFQADDLLDVIKSLKPPRQGQVKSTGFKRRVWPPVSTGTDSDEEDEPVSLIDDCPEQEDAAMNQRFESSSASPTAKPTSPDPEDAIKSLFGQLLQSLTDRMEKRLGDLLSGAIEERMPSRVRSIVQHELAAQLGDVLSHERLTTILQPLLARELPSLIQKEMSASEPLIHRAVSDMAAATINETVKQAVREQVEAGVRKQLPELVREHLSVIDVVVKEEIRQATLKQATLLADELVRTTAERAVDQAVQRLVPELAEQHIRAELKRLSDGAEDAPRLSAC
jgi:DNA-binding response OmpR family regulator